MLDYYVLRFFYDSAFCIDTRGDEADQRTEDYPSHIILHCVTIFKPYRIGLTQNSEVEADLVFNEGV